MVEKEVVENTDMKLIDQLAHRVTLLLETDKEVNESYSTQKENLTSQEVIFTEELKAIKEEVKQLQQVSQDLHKTIFMLGHQLRDKTTVSAVQAIQEKIEAWPLEEYITKKELPELFEKYAKEKQK